MKKYLYQLSLLTILALSFSACSHEPIVPRIDFIAEQDNGNTVPIQQGGYVEIDLPSSTSRDIEWQIVGNLPASLELISQPRKRMYTDTVGSAGTTTFQIKAVDQGQTTINFKALNKKLNLQTFSVTLDVSESKDFFDESNINMGDPIVVEVLEEKPASEKEPSTLTSWIPFTGEETDEVVEIKISKDEPTIESSDGWLDWVPFTGDDKKTEEEKAEAIINTLDTREIQTEEKEDKIVEEEDSSWFDWMPFMGDAKESDDEKASRIINTLDAPESEDIEEEVVDTEKEDGSWFDWVPFTGEDKETEEEKAENLINYIPGEKTEDNDSWWKLW